MDDFKIDEDSVVFVASDALSHYVLMMYELANCGRYCDELEEESRLQSSNSLLLHTAETMKFDFWQDVISPLRESAGKPSAFKSHIRSLLDRGLLDLDDTTIVFLY